MKFKINQGVGGGLNLGPSCKQNLQGFLVLTQKKKKIRTQKHPIALTSGTYIIDRSTRE